MKRLIATGSAFLALALTLAGSAFATDPHSGGSTGQPSQTCLSATALNEPGHAANARGSAFNENGGIAGGVYAGNGENTETPANGHAVSQYDVACFQVSQH